jgi:hypothetical protein
MRSAHAQHPGGTIELAGTPSRQRAAAFALPLLFLLTVLLPAALRADSDRVMVGEDIYVAEGEELENVVCFGCSIRVEGKAHDAVAFGGSIEVTGEVNDAVSFAGGLDVRGKVNGDAVVLFGSTRVRDGGRIDGDAVSILGSVRAQDSGSVGGDIVSSESWAPIALSGVVIGLIIFLVAGIVIQPLLVLLCFVLLGERRIAVLAETARRRSGMSFLIGIALCIGSFIFSIAAAMTPIISLQIPFGLIMFCVLVVGYAGVSYWVGRGMLPRSGALAAAILGAVLVTIIQLIPIVGQIAFLIFSMMALGSAVLSGFGTSIDWLAERTNHIEPVAPRTG